MGKVTEARNLATGSLYRGVAKPLYFKMDPEGVHDRMVSLGRFLGSNPLTRMITRATYSYSNPMLEQKVAGIRFPNPVGLAAGFDKNAKLTQILPEVGFGHMMIGSITGDPCKGNPKPRLWRLPESEGLVINYGLMNDGCESISKRLTGKKFKVPLGVSMAKTNCKASVSIKNGVSDYLKSYKAFSSIGSYDEINISCPNTWGGQPFENPDQLRKLLRTLSEVKTKKPMFIKISPDLTLKRLDGIMKAAAKYEIGGFTCSNLTHDRSGLKDKNIPTKGSVSGRQVRHVSTKQIQYINKKGDFTLIGCGGVFSAVDAYEKIKAGASLIQLITGLIFRGPQLVSEINQGLVKLLEKDGIKKISDAR